MLFKASGFQDERKSVRKRGKKIFEKFQNNVYYFMGPKMSAKYKLFSAFGMFTMVHGWDSLGSWNRRHGKEVI